LSELSKTADMWSKNAEAWSSGIHAGLDVINDQFGLPFFLGQLPALTGKTVLDAGCGEGRSSRALASLGARVIGVDISRSMLEQAKAKDTQSAQGITYIEASCDALTPIASASVDIITCYMALMDMPDMPNILGEFARVLKPGGEVFIMVRHPCFFTPGLSFCRSQTGERAGLTVSRYFGTTPYVDRFSFADRPEDRFEVIRYPYTLSQYMAALKRSGLLLSDLQEPTPDDAICAEHRNLAFWRLHAGIFLFLRGTLKNA